MTVHYAEPPEHHHRFKIAAMLRSADLAMKNGVLTAREVEIVQFVLKGHSNNSISLHLEISEGTVKIHRRNIYRKLEISSQSELFAMTLNSLINHDEISVFQAAN